MLRERERGADCIGNEAFHVAEHMLEERDRIGCFFRHSMVDEEGVKRAAGARAARVGVGATGIAT